MKHFGGCTLLLQAPGEPFRGCRALLHTGTIRNTGYKKKASETSRYLESPVDEQDLILPAEFIRGVTCTGWLSAGMMREIFMPSCFYSQGMKYNPKEPADVSETLSSFGENYLKLGCTEKY